MNGDALETRHKADDRIRRHRFATLRQARHQLVHANHQNAAAAGFGAASRGVNFAAAGDGFGDRVEQPGGLANGDIKIARRQLSAPGSGEKFVLRFKARLMRQLVKTECCLPVSLQIFFYDDAPVRQCLGQLKAVEILPHFGACAMAAQVAAVGVQPVTRGPAFLDR